MSINIKTHNTIKTTTEISDISNPNLLINPDFKINQRGQSTYNISPGSGYTVDRWKLWNGTLTVNSNKTITFKNVSGQAASLVQILENPCTEECMLSVYVTNLTGVGYIYGSDSSDKLTGIISLTKGLNFIKLSSCASVNIKLVPDTVALCSITIKYVKLEKGTNVTQFIEPNPATELLKCQRYYIKYHQLICIPATLFVANVSQSAGAYTPLTRHLPIKMRVDPAAKCSSMTANNGNNIGLPFSLAADSAEIKSVILNNNTTMNYYIISINDLELNAEIY